MNKDLFSKKLITLRKKHHLTQQELADKLNISNKTVSRWETGESYPDIELLSELADIFHVSIDYLLTDRENINDLERSDIISYVPCLIGLSGFILYYLLQKIDIPGLFCFLLYYLLVRFSYQFYERYTDHKNGLPLVRINTLTGFFTVSTIASYLLQVLVIMRTFGPSYAMFYQESLTVSEFFSTDKMVDIVLFKFLFGYLIAGVYAYLHYLKHIKDIEKNEKKPSENK